MCKFCTKHGAGKKWYLQAKNYMRNFEQDHKRAEFTKDFVNSFTTKYDQFLKDGKIRRSLDVDDPNWVQKKLFNWYFKHKHTGQVVPIEEANMTIDLAGQISLIPCVCRMSNSGEKKNLCMVFMAIPDDRYGTNHVTDKDIEPLEIEEAKHTLDEFADQGLVQTVWTFNTPHIGAICSCDYPYCTAIRSSKHSKGKIKSLLRSEYYAEIEESKCTGCRRCIRVCQFGAMSFTPSINKAVINQLDCFGCGVCRKECKVDAISLKTRETHPMLKNIWY